MLSIRPVAESKGFRAYLKPMFAIYDGDKHIATFASYNAARDILNDSDKIVSQWNTIPLAPRCESFAVDRTHGGFGVMI